MQGSELDRKLDNVRIVNAYLIIMVFLGLDLVDRWNAFGEEDRMVATSWILKLNHHREMRRIF